MREQHKMSQDELGKRIGCSKQTVFKYRTGIITNIPLNKIELISDIFGVLPAYLTGCEADMDYYPQLRPASLKEYPHLGRIACDTPIMADKNTQDKRILPEVKGTDFVDLSG